MYMLNGKKLFLKVVLATLIVRSQINQSLLTSIIILPDEQRCINCNSVQNEHLLFSDLRWNCLLFSELAWNISEFRIGFLVASCLFHFGVTIEFSLRIPCLFTNGLALCARPCFLFSLQNYASLAYLGINSLIIVDLGRCRDPCSNGRPLRQCRSPLRVNRPSRTFRLSSPVLLVLKARLHALALFLQCAGPSAPSLFAFH